MPLHDHFRSPMKDRLTWESLQAQWASVLVRRLNRQWLPRDFVAMPQTHVGAEIGVDVATFEQAGHSAGSLGNGGGGVATMPKVWSPPQPKAVMAAVFPDTFEVLVFSSERARRLVAAIELVSPRNKDRADARRTFLAKCGSYLSQGVSLIVMDVVTDRHFNLHDELLRWMNGPASGLLPDDVWLYAAAYRPVLRDEQPQIDVWAEPCEVGSPLPTMALRLTGDLFVGVEFESTYQEACEDTRAV